MPLQAVIFGVLVYWFCSGLWASASAADVPSPQYLVDQWDASAGLPDNGVLFIAQTPDGYLWFATLKGLARFDGLVFTTLPFREDMVDKENKGKAPNKTSPNVLCASRDGTLWIGSAAGLTRYTYKNRQFKTFTAKDRITADGIRFIYEDSHGDLWISFDTTYVNRLSSGRFTAFNDSHGLKGNKINAILEDKNGRLLMGTRENGVFMFRNERFFKYEIEGLTDDYLIITMIEDREGDLWIGTNKGLFRVSGDRVRIYTTRDGLSSDYITHFAEDNNGNLWVGAVNGLNRLVKAPSGTLSFEHFLEDLGVICLFIDRENSLWVGTYDSGARRLKKARLSSYIIEENGQEEILLSMHESQSGDIWIGTLAGRLYRSRDNQTLETRVPPGISGTGISALLEDSSGNLWLGTNGAGVFLEKKGKEGAFTSFTTREGLDDNLVISLFQDSQNDLWICTFGGVNRFRQGVLESVKIPGSAPLKVHNVYEDTNHRILLATNKGIKEIENGIFIENKMTEAFRGLSVTGIIIDQGESGSGAGNENVYWIGTDGAGLKRFKKGILTSFTTAQGMSSNFIYQMLDDGAGNLWVMSDSGILRVAKEELNWLADRQLPPAHRINCTSFGLADGMKSIEFNNMFSRHSALKTHRGDLCFITRRGIAVVQPGKIIINKFPPPVIIESVVFNHRPVSLPGDSLTNTFRNLKDLVFYFTAPTFLSPEKVTFKYKLEGYDRDWFFLPPGKKRMAQYQNLAPGTYRFKVIASNSDGVWNNTGDSFNFTLKPLFYETLWFKVTTVLFLLALALAGYVGYKKWKAIDRKAYKQSPLNHHFAEEYIKKVTTLMEVDKVYRDDTLSLQSLAEKLSIPHHQLSQLLNEKLNKNFSDFINSYRIEEAKTLLGDPKWTDRKIISIAFEVGFNTKAAFYNVFKKYTNMTPNQYRKEANGKE
jgi:ligand-binding sensor domain-containing protein/AraC-like DNA-binding protein